jgi:hypothetical protein
MVSTTMKSLRLAAAVSSAGEANTPEQNSASFRSRFQSEGVLQLAQRHYPALSLVDHGPGSTSAARGL